MSAADRFPSTGPEIGMSTHMQKKGEIKDDRARARTAKYVPRYVDQVPLKQLVQKSEHAGRG